MMQRRAVVRLQQLGSHAALLAWRVTSQHYLTLASLVVIGVLFALVMSSDSFVSRKDRPATQRASASEEPAPPRQRPFVLFYVVQDQAQLQAMSEAFADDQQARAGGPFRVDHVVFLIGGTAEEESAAISRINFETQLVQGTNIDLKVVDVRGRWATP
jgi:hypothetical protein